MYMIMIFLFTFELICYHVRNWSHILYQWTNEIATMHFMFIFNMFTTIYDGKEVYMFLTTTEYENKLMIFYDFQIILIDSAQSY